MDRVPKTLARTVFPDAPVDAIASIIAVHDAGEDFPAGVVLLGMVWHTLKLAGLSEAALFACLPTLRKPVFDAAAGADSVIMLIDGQVLGVRGEGAISCVALTGQPCAVPDATTVMTSTAFHLGGFYRRMCAMLELGVQRVAAVAKAP